jgi:tripartite-type tricarboxylate transporter receptor subunit TctC
MKLGRRAFSIVMGSSLCASPAAWAQAFPARPVKVVVTAPPGGAADFVARLMADALAKKWSQPVVVENRAGANGMIAAAYVAKEKPDGYTLLLAVASTVTLSQIAPKPGQIDPTKDLVPIASLGSVPGMLVTHPSVPYKSIPELIAYAKANPDAVTFGTPGVGHSLHIAFEMMAHMAGIKMRHVPYKGTGPVMADLMGGQIHLALDSPGPSANNRSAGRVRILGTTALQRLNEFPDVPALSETLAGYENAAWFVLMAPTGTPADLVAQINRDVNQASRAPDYAKRLSDQGLIFSDNTASDIAARLRRETEGFTKLVRDANIKIE